MSKRITTEQLAEKVDKLQDTLNVIVELMGSDIEQVEVEEPETITCQVHGVPMQRRDGPYGTFYNHGKQIGRGQWVNCHGNGFRMNKQNEG